MTHVNIQIYGLVQGVTFRFSAKKVALELSIVGYVKNQNDGSVYVEAEGKKENIDKFINWCRRGPQKARVEKIIITISDKLNNYSSFKSIH